MFTEQVNDDDDDDDELWSDKLYVPLMRLLFVSCFQLHWMLSSIRTMIVLKKAKLRAEISQTQSQSRKDK